MRRVCQQLTGFVDLLHPDDVCLLSRSLYGLRQEPRAWFERFVRHVTSLGYVQSKVDSTLFVYHDNGTMANLILHVDDMILSALSVQLLRHIIALLQDAFAMTMKDMGPLKYFLDIGVWQTSEGFFLSQTQYAEDLSELGWPTAIQLPLLRTPSRRPPLQIASSSVSDATNYQSLASTLQYLTITPPDIA